MSDRISVGIVGFGNHVRKNMLRLFNGAGEVDLHRILVRDAGQYDAAYPTQAGLFTSDAAAFFADPAMAVVYIATPISTHADYARRALEAGKHVWCEKTMTTSRAETEVLVALAAAKGLMLAEIAMYRHHAQFRQVQAILAEKQQAGQHLVNARARFTIPELPPGDIRYSRELGGGALLDVGYYPISLTGALFGDPSAIAASGFLCPQRGVDLSGAAMLGYGQFAVHCLWAIGAAYANELELSFTDSTYLVPRAFSKPPTLETAIQITQANGTPGDPLVVPANDQFANLFTSYAATIRQGDTEAYAELGKQALQAATMIEAVAAAIRHDQDNGASSEG